MSIVLVAIHLVAAFILVTTVLLQAGKGAGMGAAFGGSSGTVFGTRGPATLISKITCVAAVIFMCTSLNLALSQGGVSKKGSVMDSWQDNAPVASPVVAPAAEPAAASPAASPVPAAPAADAASEAPAGEAPETSAETPASDVPAETPAEEAASPDAAQ